MLWFGGGGNVLVDIKLDFHSGFLKEKGYPKVGHIHSMLPC